MINFDGKTKLFHLSTDNTSYVFGFFKEKFLLHLYWGKKLVSEINDYETLFLPAPRRSMSTSDYPGELASFSRDCMTMEFPTFGNTDLRSPAFHARYADGSTVTELEYKSHKIVKGKPALEGLPATYAEDGDDTETLVIELEDKLTGVNVYLSYSVFSVLDAITRSVKVVNNGKNTVDLETILSASVDFNNNNYDFVHLPGLWTRERHPERVPLFRGKQAVESMRGLSSGNHNPFFALAEKNATELSGSVYGFNLVYSGNFTAGVEVDSLDMSRAFIGINPLNFDFVLESGMSFQSPEAVLVFSDEGLSGMSRIYHKLYRTRLCRGKFRDTERYVLINNWEATYFNFNEEKILAIAKKASECGIELMVLDDGWFGKRNDDHSSLGDWFVNTEKLPDGIGRLAEKVGELGMKFGLWFEPEMVSADSDCYRAHPDWCIHVKDRVRSEGRNQLMLDLSRADVCDYIIDSVGSILASADISYVKWDYNRSMSNPGSALLDARHQGEFYHRYILGLYRVLETLTSRFPNVLFESCSSGGNRFDPGMLFYMPQTWASDDTDAKERVFIQYGTSYCYPYSSMGAHVSAIPNHQIGRTPKIESRANVAMPGQFGYELDLNKLTDDEIEQVKAQVKQYKRLGKIFHTGDVYRISTPETDFSCVEFVSEDKNTVVLDTFVVSATPNGPIEYVKLAGLDRTAKYALEGSDKVYGGDLLMSVGIPYRRQWDYASSIMVFNKI